MTISPCWNINLFVIIYGFILCQRLNKVNKVSKIEMNDALCFSPSIYQILEWTFIVSLDKNTYKNFQNLESTLINKFVLKSGSLDSSQQTKLLNEVEMNTSFLLWLSHLNKWASVVGSMGHPRLPIHPYLIIGSYWRNSRQMLRKIIPTLNRHTFDFYQNQ